MKHAMPSVQNNAPRVFSAHPGLICDLYLSSDRQKGEMFSVVLESFAHIPVVVLLAHFVRRLLRRPLRGPIAH